MTDLTFTRSGELDLTQVQGNTDDGVEFVDAYPASMMEVVDSGQIIVPTDDVAAIERAAAERDLTFEHELVADEAAAS